MIDEKTLDELVEEDSPITYGVVKPGPEDNDGILFIRGGDVANGQVLVNQLRTITKEVSNQYKRTLLRGGELVISLVGNPGQVAIVPDSLKGANIARQVGLVRLKNTANKEYIKYYLLSRDGQLALGAQSLGSVQQVINLKDLRLVKIPLPPLSEQRAIAGILGALDDKIELNRRMNHTLESMARAVFHQRFVENEDVADWDVMSIEQVAERVAMGPFGSSIKVETFVEEGIPIISGQHLRNFMLQDTTYNFISLDHAERLKNANVQRGDVIFTHAGNVGNLAFIPEDSEYERYVVSQRQFYMRCNLEFVTPTFITFYFQSPEGQHKLLANMSSVGVPSIAQPVSYLRSIELSIPPKPILDEFEKFVSPLLKKYRANEKESHTLTTLRDSLLPKLIKGEIRVTSLQ